MKMKTQVAILISGRGSNMQAIIQDSLTTDCPYQVCLVLSNRPDAQGLQIAQAAGIATEVIESQNYPQREWFDSAMQQKIAARGAEVVALAGFMRIVSPSFVQAMSGRMINIHPSLLPKFKGLHTHERVLQAGETEHGATVHFVSAELDSGAIILQAKVPVLPTDDVATLAARVLTQEHTIYPQALRWLAQGRVVLRDKQAYLDGQPLCGGAIGVKKPERQQRSGND